MSLILARSLHLLLFILTTIRGRRISCLNGSFFGPIVHSSQSNHIHHYTTIHGSQGITVSVVLSPAGIGVHVKSLTMLRKHITKLIRTVTFVACSTIFLPCPTVL